MSTSRLGEAEQALLVMWRRFRRSRADPRHEELDAVQRALLDAWRRCGEPPAARPPWAEALRYRLNEQHPPTIATTGLFGRSGYLTDSPSRVLGMLLGGAVAEARARGHVGERTTAVLFVLESLVRAHTRLRVTGTAEPIHSAFRGLQRWMHTRGVAWRDCVGDDDQSPAEPDGWLVEHLPRGTASDDPAMLTALARAAAGQPLGTARQPVNRASSATATPLGALGALWSNADAAVFDLSTGLAMVTHGDERGHTPAGILGVTVSGLLRGRSLRDSIHAALEYGTDEGVVPMREAAWFDEHRPVGRRPTRRNLEAMTDGRTGAGALAIAVRAALACPDDFDTAVGIAADHHGDTVTSAVVCGQLLGVLHGPTAIPPARREALAIGPLVERLSADAAEEFGPNPDESAEWSRRYSVPDPPASEPAATAPAESAHWQARFAGGVLGCAVGEALGTPITPESWDEIHRRYGAHGLGDYVPAGHPAGRLGSDSQLLLFSLEGVIRAGVHRRNTGNTDPTRHIQHAHQRWLHTQHLSWPRAAGEFLGQAPEPDGWLVGQRALFQTRTPGRTMMRTLIAFAKGQQGMGTPEEPVSDSRGSAAVLRAVPAALWSNEPAEVFRVARNTAALTHGSPAAYLSAGALAVLISRLMHEEPLPVAADTALNQLSRHPGHEDVTRAIEAARQVAVDGPVDPVDLEHRLGAGWTAPEALSIGLYAALACGVDFDTGLRAAVNHSGNSATTAAVCGSLLGATFGSDGIPTRWITDLELAEIIERLASDAVLEFGPRPPTGQEWSTRYPPT